MTPMKRMALTLHLLLFLLAVVLAALLLSGPATGVERPATIQSSAETAVRAGRYYYLTDADVASDAALAACAPGYRMASLWEIVDPSNLTYAYDHPDAHTKADSGQGPPSEWFGRVRTGGPSSVANNAGTGNCAAWTSVDGGDYGSFVRLTRAWEAPPGEIGGIWDAHAFGCNLDGPVWCVADFHALYLPTIMTP